MKKTKTGLLNAEIVEQMEKEDTTGSELEVGETHSSPITSRNQEDENDMEKEIDYQNYLHLLTEVAMSAGPDWRQSSNSRQLLCQFIDLGLS